MDLAGNPPGISEITVPESQDALLLQASALVATIADRLLDAAGDAQPGEPARVDAERLGTLAWTAQGLIDRARA